MVFLIQKAIDTVKLLLLITIGLTAKLTYDLTTTNYVRKIKTNTHEQKINEKITHQKFTLGNFEIAEH